MHNLYNKLSTIQLAVGIKRKIATMQQAIHEYLYLAVFILFLEYLHLYLNTSQSI